MKQTKEWFFPTNKIGEDEKKKKLAPSQKINSFFVEFGEERTKKQKNTKRDLKRGSSFGNGIKEKIKDRAFLIGFAIILLLI